MGSATSISFRDVTDYLTITESKVSRYVYDEHGKRKHYLPPHVRKEARFKPDTESTSKVNAVDAQIDKYDYVLVFPWAEIEPLPPSLSGDRADFKKSNFVDSSKKIDHRRFINWSRCEQMWEEAVVGTKEEKLEAVKELRAFMKERFDFRTAKDALKGNIKGKEEDIDEECAHKDVYYFAWLALAREAICERLCTKCGFQMKLTEKSSKATRRNPREGRVLCRLRAPISRLEAMADEVNYSLQLREEVDPGSEEFWNVEDENAVAIELEDERVLYEQHQAVEILKELARLGKISKSEVEVTISKEKKSDWSRRVHVLERVADRIPTFNKYNAYAAFTTQPKLRYLFKEYPNVRGRTILQYKDRLYLTKLLIEKCFDLEVFTKQNNIFGDYPPVIDSYTALHDANRGDEVTIETLFRNWVTFWRATGKEVGVPYVSHIAYEGNQFTYVNLLQRPFSQPLSQIRSYFGEKIGLFFAWHGMYTYYLVIPCLFGVAMEGIYVYRGYVDAIDNIDWPLQVFNILIVIWATVYIQHWKGEQKAISLKWGTESFEENEKDRPQFHGDNEREESHQMSFVNNELVLYFPEEKRFRIQIATSILVLIVTLMNCGLIGCIFWLEYLVETYYTEYEFTYFTYAVAALLAIEINISSYFFFWFVTYLNDIENHQTNSKYEDALVQKVVGFQMFNFYGALLFTAFGKGYVFDNCSDTCMSDLRILLYAIVAVRGADLILDILFSMLYKLFFGLFVAAEGSYDREQEDEETPLMATANQKSGQQSQAAEIAFMTEIDKPEFTDRDVFDSYSGVVIQFGYLTFFSVAFPMVCVILMVESLLRLRANAFKLCSLRRRPHIQLAEDIGKWEYLVEVFNILGILSSVGILTFTTEQFTDYDMTEQVLLFLLHEFGIILIVLMVQFIVPAIPGWVDDVKERNKFIVNKYVKGIEEYEISLKLDESDSSLDGNIDVELLQLSGTLRGMTDEERQLSAELRANRRKKMKELNGVKATIARYAHGEIFDENSGIAIDPLSEFALGMLQIRLGSIVHIDEVRRVVELKRKALAEIANAKLNNNSSSTSKKAPVTTRKLVTTSSNTSNDSGSNSSGEQKTLDLGLRLKVSVVGHDGNVIGVQYSVPLRDNRVGVQSYLIEELLPAFTGIGTRLAVVVFEVVLNADMGIDHLLLEYKQDHEYIARKIAGLEDFFADLAGSFDSKAAVDNSRQRSVKDMSSTVVGAAGGGAGTGAGVGAGGLAALGRTSFGRGGLETMVAAAESEPVNNTEGNNENNNEGETGDENDGTGFRENYVTPITSTLAMIPVVGAVFETEEEKQEREAMLELDKKWIEMEKEIERLNNKVREQYALKQPELVLMVTSFDLNEPVFNDQVSDKTLVLPMHFLVSSEEEASNSRSLWGPAISSKTTHPTAISLAGKESRAKLSILVTFQFSKLALTRNRVAVLQREMSEIERQIAEYKVEASRRIKQKAERDAEIKKMEKEKQKLMNNLSKEKY